MSNTSLRKNSDKHRIQIDIYREQLAAMDQVMTFAGLRDRKELFENAMTIFEWAVGEARKGRRIASYDEENDVVEKVIFPALNNATERARRNSIKEEAAPLDAVVQHLKGPVLVGK